MSWSQNPFGVPYGEVAGEYMVPVTQPKDRDLVSVEMSDEAREITFYFNEVADLPEGTFDQKMVVVKLDENENDEWKLGIMESKDGGASYKAVGVRKPVKISTSGGGGDTDSGVVVFSSDYVMMRIRNRKVEVYRRKLAKKPWWASLMRSKKDK